jgi:hypothetical protein
MWPTLQRQSNEWMCIPPPGRLIRPTRPAWWSNSRRISIHLDQVKIMVLGGCDDLGCPLEPEHITIQIQATQLALVTGVGISVNPVRTRRSSRKNGVLTVGKKWKVKVSHRRSLPERYRTARGVVQSLGKSNDHFGFTTPVVLIICAACRWRDISAETRCVHLPKIGVSGSDPSSELGSLGACLRPRTRS